MHEKRIDNKKQLEIIKNVCLADLDLNSMRRNYIRIPKKIQNVSRQNHCHNKQKCVFI